MKRLIFWDFPRASWQYDVVVALILAFIFLTPRDIFRDQPRAASVVRLPVEHGPNAFWIEPDLLAGRQGDGLRAAAQELVRKQTSKPAQVVRVEAILNSEQETQGYVAYLKP